MEKEKDGVWRTIRGRRIFISKGESLGQAMAKSGKFNRSDIRETKAGLSQKDKFDRTNSKSLKQRQNAIKDFRKKDTRYSNSVYTTDRQDIKNQAEPYSMQNKKGKTRVERNYDRYSQEDRRELRHEELKKQLENYKKANYDYSLADKSLKEVEKAKKQLADFKAKKQSNNKIETERELYERAKNNPDSIDPMTENSTDWEALEKKYGNNIEDSNTYKFGNQKYNTRIEKNFDNYGRADRDEAINNEVKKAVKEIKNNEKEETYKSRIGDEFNTKDWGEGAYPLSQNAWKGSKSDSGLYGKDKIKAIDDDIKKAYPEIKTSRLTNRGGYTDSFSYSVVESDKPIIRSIESFSDEEINKLYNKGYNSRWYKSVNEYKDALTKDLQSGYLDINQYNIDDDHRLTPYGKQLFKDIVKVSNAYNYDESDGMTDYFNTGHYISLSVGKSGKPFVVNDKKAKIEAFKKRKGK